VGAEFDNYWEAQKQSALVTLSQDEGLKGEALDKVLANYLFTEKTPMRDDVIGIMETRPVLSQSFWAFPSVRNGAMLFGQT
jgi:type I restriction enzyme R subunit